jgi:hypothetical protein
MAGTSPAMTRESWFNMTPIHLSNSTAIHYSTPESQTQ